MEKQQHDHTLVDASSSSSSFRIVVKHMMHSLVLWFCCVNAIVMAINWWRRRPQHKAHTLSDFKSIRKNHEPQQSLEFPLFTHREYWSFCHLLTSHLLPFFSLLQSLVWFEHFLLFSFLVYFNNHLLMAVRCANAFLLADQHHKYN